MDLSNQVLAVARQYADQGYKEKPGNDNIFGIWYGRNKVAWCAIFVSYCYNQAGAGAILNGIQTDKGFHSCNAAVNVYHKRNQIRPTIDAKPGDIVFMNFTGSGSHDHVGIVIRNNTEKKQLFTVEGNTINPDGTGDQVNGDGVYYKTRSYKYVTAIVRPSWKLIQKDK